MRRVVHTAQALVDEVVEVEALPPRGGNAVAGAHRRYAGGAVTILLAAARAGADAVHAGAIGTGPNADLVRQVLASEQIACAAPPVADVDTGVCIVLIEPDGERTFVTTQGAERLITTESLAASAPQPGDLLCVSGYSFVGRTRAPLLAWLSGLDDGVSVVLDPGAPFADLEPALIERVLTLTHVWSSNSDEARRLTGLHSAGLAELGPAVAQRLRPDAVVVVRDGPAGCVVQAHGASQLLPGFPQRAVDTNGAGDTHTGVLLAGVAAGLEWPVAATRANAAAAIKVTRRGPVTAPTAAEVDAFLARETGDS